MIDASASLPLVAIPAGGTPSRFHLPVVPSTRAEKELQAAAAKAPAASRPPSPVRSPNPFRAVQARLVLSYAEPRTVRWSQGQE